MPGLLIIQIALIAVIMILVLGLMIVAFRD